MWLDNSDSSSSESTSPPFFNSVKLVDKLSDKYSSNKSSEKNYYDKQEMSKEHSKSDKHKSSVKYKRVSYNNLKQNRNKNKKLDSSDSEDEVDEKYVKRKGKKPLLFKSKQKDFIDLYKDEAESSSGKEFQTSTMFRNSSEFLKTLIQSKKDCVMSADSNPKFAMQTESRITISEKQSLQFKAGVIKILNKLKEICSEYELQMELIKYKHVTKELVYQESASKIIEKSSNVINKLKLDLDAQENKLRNFYKEWNEHCRNTDHKDSSLSENEILEKTGEEKKEEVHKLQSNSSVSSIVSECDSDKIFSHDETHVTKVNIEDKNKKDNNLILAKVSEKLIVADSKNSDQIISPILDSSKEKGTFSEMNAKDGSKLTNETDTFKEHQNFENEHLVNKSVDDIFDESIIENIENTNNSEKNEDEHKNKDNLKLKEIIKKNNKDEHSLENKEMNTESKNKNSSAAHEERLERTGEEENYVSDETDEDEQAKRAMLDSGSETPSNEESLVEKSMEQLNRDNSLKQRGISERKVEEFGKGEKKKNKIQTTSVHKDSSVDKQNRIMEVEACAKRALLESNSDDSMSPSDIKKSSVRKPDSDDNNEDSSSDNGNKLKIKNANSIKKNIKELEEDSSENGEVSDSRVRTCLFKVNYTESDEKLRMISEVVVERLPKKILEKYRDALENSRQYLEYKAFKSLINIDRLKRNNKNISSSPRGALPKISRKAKSKEKEEEDSLLDHLKKVQNGECVENIGEDSSVENDDSISKTQSTFKTNEQLMIEADAATKRILLYSSDSDIDVQKVNSESNNSEEERNKSKSKDCTKKSSEKAKKDSDKEKDEEWKKNKWRRDKLLTMKFSSNSDSDTAKEKWNKKQDELKERKEAEEDHTEDSVTKNIIVKRKRRNRRKIMDSDDTDIQLNSDTESNSSDIIEDNKSLSSSSSIGKQKKGRKRKTRKSSDTDSSFVEKSFKPKRRRIKNMPSDSDISDNDQITNSQGTPGKRGRKNIRKVMKDKQIADDTKQAAKEEEERLKRIAERQKLYNEMYEARLADEEKVEKLVLDFNPDTKEELVTVHENLVKRLKPHQAKGIKFMWDACFESLERLKSSTGSGCIIAHCMGLGKTLQVIALVHTLLTHEEIGVKTVMIVSPLSTVLNWLHEFNFWLKDIEDNDINIYEMTKLKKNIERKYQLERWQRTGGVLIIGYEMFRNLSGTNNRIRKNIKETILQCLIDPGPDVIVCDEGHLLKNEDSALSKSIKRIKTLRRIVLTGTPLQNNLIEYHCMVQFVKPNLLGTRKEFLNRFVNPITNGQFDDSTEYDVKLMKKRAYVLHKMLKGCVQRFDYSVLTPFLPPKQEYVIFVRLTEVQINMYRHYLEVFARQSRNASGSLFADFQALQRIWTHPLVLRLNAEKMEKLNEKKLDSSDSEGSLRDFIDDDETEITLTTTSSESEDDEVRSIDSSTTVKNTRANLKNSKLETEVIQKSEECEKKEEEWWLQFIQPEHFEDMRISSKLILLFGILKECEQIGDKVLVFSQSLYSLTLIEYFLDKIDNNTQNSTNSEYVNGHSGSWSLGLDYFRLDGQTSAENRNRWCKIFNKPSNTRARLFLISTRAGGLGINLTAANRVIMFDASWNPSHDVQSIFRIYRFGQKKPCYVYRFLAAGTMEEKIYNRQVTKLSLSCRVVDEQQIERHYSNQNLNELYNFEPNVNNENSTLNLPKDRLLAEIFLKYKDSVENYHEHDSLLENKTEEELDEEERKQAWLEYEEEKKGKLPMAASYSAMPTFTNHVMPNQFNIQSAFNFSDYNQFRELIQKDYPNATPEAQQMMANRALTDMYTYWEQQSYHNVANRMLNQNAGVKPVQMRTQLPNLPSRNYLMQNINTNTNLTNQSNDYRTNHIRHEELDDDVVEVTSSTVSNTNKNQEE
ncbi:unnamed protein product [Xylocopa violacea]|uniref:Transcriptional regulator ATRX-like protein n=1 Tax=Xylocopa violacea TaxID=135666 RepID=A0ABP1MXK0_XYLVO